MSIARHPLVMFATKPAAASSYLLDTYTGAAAAYSLRQLKTGISNVIRVRRSSDSTEQDFTPTQITDGTLTTFTGANDGYVTKLYDQSGNSRDALQANASLQPRIVSSGVLETVNSKPTINYLTGTTTYLRTASTSGINQPTTCINVWKSPTTNVRSPYDGTSLVTGVLTIMSATSLRCYAGTALLLTVSDVTNVTGLSWLRFSGTNSAIGYNGGSLSIGDAGTTNMGGVTIGVLGNLTSQAYEGWQSELIIYPSDVVSNRAGIEAEINAYYTIY